MLYHWIDTPDAASRALTALGNNGWLALDTEFVREKTFYPQLALLQVAGAGGEPLLFDPTAAGVASVLGPWVAAARVITHSASEDLQALRRGTGSIPAALFDTQIAAAFAGVGTGMGYQALLAATLGIAVDKGETRSDWLQRPLTERQLAYAADDVRHLHALQSHLVTLLQANGRLEWALADMERLRSQALNDEDERHPHLALRSAAHLDADGQARLSRWLRWRDAQARERDLPKRWLLENDLAMALAKRDDWRRGAFDALLDSQEKPPRRFREVLWAELERQHSESLEAVPLLRDPGPGERDSIKRLQAAVASVAQAHDMPDTLLCSRRHLEALLGTGLWPNALEGWRRPLLETPLRQALDR